MGYAFNLTQLISVATAATILDKGLLVARMLKLPVDSWRAGDPTRSLYHYLAELLSTRDEAAAEYIRAGFLGSARGEWLHVLAQEVYDYTPNPATSAKNSMLISNTGGGYYGLDAGQLVLRSSVTGKTYHNAVPVTFTPNTANVTVQWIADEPGADSSVGENEIDEFVTGFDGLTIVSSAAGYGADAESEPSIKQNCLDSLGATSPNGPREAYDFVARSAKLTGSTEVTRARASGDTGNGDIFVSIASAAGPVSELTLQKVERAIVVWATHIGGTPHVQNAGTTGIVYDVILRARAGMNETLPNVRTAIGLALKQLHADTPIAREGDYLAAALIKKAIAKVYESYTYDVILVSPTGDVPLLAGSVPVIHGTPTVAVEYRT